MKTKLTVSIDKDLVPQAKLAARSRGISLSQLIEISLRAAAQSGGSTFSQRWRGCFEPADHDDDRYQSLADRYL